MLKSAKEVSGSFLTERQVLNIILGYADLAQLDTLPAGGVQMATEQSEALGRLLRVLAPKGQKTGFAQPCKIKQSYIRPRTSPG